MKKLFGIVVIVMMVLGLALCVKAEPEGMRDYDGIEVPVGSFIPVMSLQEISTAYCDGTNELKFVCYNDVYEFETVIIPKGTVFYGYIEKKNEPVIGTHASMVIRITKLVYTDGFTIPMVGYIYTANGNLIGGDMTMPEKWDKMPHFHKGISRHFVGVQQYVPGPVRKMGEHVKIESGADLLIVVVKPLFITHTLY